MKTLSSSRKILFSFIMILLCIVCAEAITFAFFKSITGVKYSKSEIKDLIKEQAASQDKNDQKKMEKRMYEFNSPWPESIHPYLGYVPDPKRIDTVNDYGFWGTNSPIRKKSGDTLIVGVLGGSFATQLTGRSEDALLEALGASGLPVILINLAHGGNKQPQQMMIAAYLFSLGAEFDVLINVDGFNEVALPVVENMPVDVFPFYPRAWSLRSQNFIGMEDANKQIGLIAYLRGKRGETASNALKLKLYRSPVLSMLWLNKDRKFGRQIFHANQELDQVYAEKKGNRAYVTTGPAFNPPPGQNIYEIFADHWARCSIQLNAMCNAYETRYIHILQPNQYVIDSKPLSDEEKLTGYDENSHYLECVRKGYPELFKSAEYIRAAGVEYYDFTGIFSNISETFYMDNCCHLNTNGYDFIAREIGRVVNR